MMDEDQIKQMIFENFKLGASLDGGVNPDLIDCGIYDHKRRLRVHCRHNGTVYMLERIVVDKPYDFAAVPAIAQSLGRHLKYLASTEGAAS